MRQITKRFLLVSMALCCGCPGLLPDRELQRYVSEEEVIGTWVMTAKSLTLLTRDGFKKEATHKYRIEFLPNGVCRFQSVVDFIPGSAYYDMTGKWELEHDTTGDSDLECKNYITVGPSQSSHVSVFHGLNLAEEGGKIILYGFYGDPDCWEFIEYTKADVPVVPAEDSVRPEQ